MAAATLAATLNTPLSDLRSVPTGQILLIEEDGALRKILQRLFFSEGYEVDVVPDNVAGLEILRQRSFSAVIVDLQDPGPSGCNLCKEIANVTPGLPLVILSTSSKVADKVRLLEMGADDYVTIPFSPRELAARVRASIRRTSRFSLDLAVGGIPAPVAIHSIARTSARRVRLVFESSRNTPHITEIGVYDEPEYYRAE